LRYTVVDFAISRFCLNGVAMCAVPAVKIRLSGLDRNKTVKVASPKHTEREVEIRTSPRHVEEDDRQVRSPEELVLKYRLKARKLARSILRKWHARLDLQEVDSLVDLSLCEAVRRYNPEKGASFMTFMFFHLRGNLIRAVAGAVHANSIPTFEDETPAQSAAPAEHHEEDSNAHRTAYRVASASEVAEALCSHDRKLPDEMLFQKELVAISAEACSRLDPLEREVISRIYMQEQQLLDIADTLGYSRCHISRVKKRALEALYHDLAVSVGEDEKAKPSFEDEDAKAKAPERRTVRRRRPRAGKAVAAASAA